MSPDDRPEDFEISSPIEQRAALDLYFDLQDRGYLPYLVELDDGSYMVHCGERMAAA